MRCASRKVSTRDRNTVSVYRMSVAQVGMISEHNVSCKAGTSFPYIQCQILNGENDSCPAGTGIPCSE